MNKMLKNEFGQFKEAKTGFSWTVFFFGPFVPLFRGDFKYFGIMILVAIFTTGLGNIVFPFMYNKWYTQDLIEKGYRTEDREFAQFLRYKGIFVPEQKKVKSESIDQDIF